jgi:hypothetical protein
MDDTQKGGFFGNFQTVHRSGLRDPAMRVAVNLYGAPAMDLTRFSKYTRKRNLGARLNVVAPLGQYDGNPLINLGSNRWAFKPEIGFSQAFNERWILELDAGAWLFTANDNFLGATRTQTPIASVQLHAVYTVRPHFWFSLDGNFYNGGRTTVGMMHRLDLQRGSRIGLTMALPIARRQALKFAYSRWAYATVGAKFNVFTTPINSPGAEHSRVGLPSGSRMLVNESANVEADQSGIDAANLAVRGELLPQSRKKANCYKMG